MDLSLSSAQTKTPGEGRGRRTMKVVSFQLALQAAILAVVLAAAGRANATDTSAVSKRGFAAKIRYCQDCHGLLGQGYRGFLPIPRLAGQQTEYFRESVAGLC